MEFKVREKDTFNNFGEYKKDTNLGEPESIKNDSDVSDGGVDILETPELTEMFNGIPSLMTEDIIKSVQTILAFDGGGTRGYYSYYSSLLILRELMRHIGQFEYNEVEGEGTDKDEHNEIEGQTNDRDGLLTDWTSQRPSRRGCENIAYEERYLPCQYFDYMVGTRTGGLLAIMLGRLRMSVEDCINEYIGIGELGFSYKQNLRSKRTERIEERNQDIFKTAINSIIERRLNLLPLGMRNPYFESPSSYCKTMVLAIRSDGPCEVPYILRSYNHFQGHPLDPYERNPGPASPLLISEVARATSAAPTYFKSFELDGKRFLDGGFGTNNPSIEACFEVQKLLHQGSEPAILAVSIGTGISMSKRRKRVDLKRCLTTMFPPTAECDDSECVHHGMEHLRKGSKLSYRRFNVGASMWTFHGKCGRNRQKDELGEMEKLTSIYLSEPRVQQHLQQLAKVLVVRRRLANSDVSSAISQSEIVSEPVCVPPLNNSLDNDSNHQGLGMKIIWPLPGTNSLDDELVADIVFVHGPWGSRESTWTAEGQLWPRTLLAKDFPNSRIITYGYFADPVAFFDSRSENAITTLAKSFISDLQAIRKSESKSRPLILFAHSLGGLLVKDVMHRCHIAESRAKEVRDLAELTRSPKDLERAEKCESLVDLRVAAEAGALFFAGTPHQGPKKASMTEWFRGFQMIYGDNQKVVSDLNTEIIDRLQEEFSLIMNRFHIYGLRERAEDKKIGFIVEPTSAMIGCEHEIVIDVHANHVDMVKFSMATDCGYVQIKNQMGIIFDRLARKEFIIDIQNPSDSSRVASPYTISSYYSIVEDILQDAEQSLDQFLFRKAECELAEAHSILEKTNSSDAKALTRVYNGLVKCQIQKTWRKGLVFEDHVRYLQKAQYYADKVLSLSEPTTSLESKRSTCLALEDVKRRCAELGITFPVQTHKR